MSQIEIRTSKNPRTGKTEKVVWAKNKNGKWIRLLNPAQKSRKYSSDLKSGRDTISGKPLRDTQKAFRSGYLKSRSDNAKAYKSKKAKRARNKK